MANRALGCFFGIFLCIASQRADCQERPVFYLLSRRIETQFEPNYVLLISKFEHGALRIAEGTVSQLEDNKHYLVVAAFTKQDEEVPLATAGLVFGANGEALTAPVQEVPLEQRVEFDKKAVKEGIVATQLSLAQIKDREKKEEDSLQRLKGDVDTISDIGRIIKVRAELTTQEEALQKLRAMRESLTNSETALSKAEPPALAVIRESALIEQGIDLAQAQKLKAPAKESATPQDKRELLLTLAKKYNPEVLKEELRQLRQQSAQLE
jgi:hypothetical protein